MGTHYICFLWRTEENYPRIIIKYACLTSPLFGNQVALSLAYTTVRVPILGSRSDRYRPVYRTHPKILYRQAWANTVDPDQTQQDVASDQGLHCLPLILQFVNTSAGSKLVLF